MNALGSFRYTLTQAGRAGDRRLEDPDLFHRERLQSYFVRGGFSTKIKCVLNFFSIHDMNAGQQCLPASGITRVSGQKDAEICLVRARNRLFTPHAGSRQRSLHDESACFLL